MNVKITSFHNPFSFFCISEKNGKDMSFDLTENFVQIPQLLPIKKKMEMSDVNHGQYVAVIWNNKWVRGLVTMETQFRIWLIDYGFHLRVNENTIYINLPAEYKKYPTKVFEASIHGVAPVDKVLTDECDIQSQITNTWNAGAIEKAQSLITNATRIFFVPIALMSTKNNDVVIGDLYLELKQKKIVNIVDELELWPVFLEKNKAAYIENLPAFYTSRKKHRACLLKPTLAPDLPTISFETTFAEYTAICANAPQFDVFSEGSIASGDGTTVVGHGQSDKDESKELTPGEIELFSNMYVTVCGRELNVLYVLITKARDLNMCEKYKDHDHKGVGRAWHRTTSIRAQPNLYD